MYKGLSTCQIKGLLDNVAILDRFIIYTKFKDENIIFQKGMESIYQLPKIYGFNGWNSEYFYARMQSLMQSGIDTIFQKTYDYHYPNLRENELRKLKESTNVENDSVVRAYSLQTSIVTLFIIYWVGIAVTMASFLLEFCWNEKSITELKKIYYKVEGTCRRALPMHHFIEATKFAISLTINLFVDYVQRVEIHLLS